MTRRETPDYRIEEGEVLMLVGAEGTIARFTSEST
jgi:hypothetical protein